MAGALADVLAVDPRTVAAAEIAHSDGRRFHFQTAMAAGDIRMEPIPGHSDVAILGPAKGAPGGPLEDLFVLREVAMNDGQRDPGGSHTRPAWVLLPGYLPVPVNDRRLPE